MIKIDYATFSAVSVVNHDNKQLIKIKYNCSETAHLFFNVCDKEKVIAKDVPIAFSSGKGFTYALLPLQKNEFTALWKIFDKEGNLLFETTSLWKKPREWKLTLMVSSHTVIGLHNSQYIQRFNSSKFTDMAMKLCDETENQSDKYRYTMEGTWFLNNYKMDRTKEEAERLKSYIKDGKIGVCSGVAGNCIQTYGLEEMCRSTYERKKLYENWGIESKTITMIDNNSLPLSMIQPYQNAGYENIIFAPNQWCPLLSSVWNIDSTLRSCPWSTNSRGGGSRIDVSYESNIPMAFYWEDEKENRLFVFASTQYNYGSEIFGLLPTTPYDNYTLPKMLQSISESIPMLEEKYPYDMWFSACYCDDQEPSLHLLNSIKAWNKNWKYPHFEIMGNPDTFFNEFKEKFEDKIPVLRGDITGGWYQLAVSVADVLARKFEVDRRLPNSEKWATIASLLGNYTYPEEKFRRAWDYLLFNDEHSYGASGYQGRRVYETWLQHNDWIEKARETADEEMINALTSIAGKIETDEDSIVVFNPTMQKRTELIEKDGKCGLYDIAPFGYTLIKKSTLSAIEEKETENLTIENKFYKVSFSPNGSIKSIYDKEIRKNLIKDSANEILYTRDNHITYSKVKTADIRVKETPYKTTVIVNALHEELGAEIVQVITLPSYEKRIDIDNRIYHAKDMVNSNRYYRYLYFAFPFMMENPQRLCHLNGTVAEYAKSVTGHGTDVYMAVNEWCVAQNEDFGVALLMKDSQLIEFDHIHPDKTDFGDAGEGSQMFVYAANDYLQMHVPGGSHLDYRFRFSITSFKGDYESANIPQMAERYTNPVEVLEIKPQQGTLKEESMSFLNIENSPRLLCLKKADDSKGIIARFYGKNRNIAINEIAGEKVNAERNTIVEKRAIEKSSDRFITYRIGKENISLPIREEESLISKTSTPSPIGAYYTGLITKPMAIHGENPGLLYLLWGHNKDENFSYYKLYRSKSPDFEADESTFVADVFPEEYVVGRYIDTDLENHTRYFYKVCAVNTDGILGEISETFSAFTKEIIE